MSNKLVLELVELLHTQSTKTPEKADIIVRWDNDTVALYHVLMGSSLSQSIHGHDALCLSEPGEDPMRLSSGKLLKARVYDVVNYDDEYDRFPEFAWRKKYISGGTRDLIGYLTGKKFFHGGFPGRVPLSKCYLSELGESDPRNKEQVVLVECPVSF